MIAAAMFAFQNLVTTSRIKSAAVEKLQEFSTFGNGWAFGEGRKFSPRVLGIAQQMVSRLNGNIDVFPGRNGEIIVTLYLSKVSYDFVIDSSCKLSIVREDENGEETEVGVIHALSEASSPLNNPGLTSKWNWRSSDSYTLVNTSNSGNASRVLHLPRRAATAEYHVSPNSAPQIYPAAYALTA